VAQVQLRLSLLLSEVLRQHQVLLQEQLPNVLQLQARLTVLLLLLVLLIIPGLYQQDGQSRLVQVQLLLQSLPVLLVRTGTSL